MIMQGGIYNDFAIFACLMNHRILYNILSKSYMHQPIAKSHTNSKENHYITMKIKYEHKRNVVLHHLQ